MRYASTTPVSDPAAIASAVEAGQKSHQQLLLDEANHRCRNLSAVMGSLVTLLAPRHNDITLFSKEVLERFTALDRAHALAWRAAPDDGLPMAELIATIIAPYAGSTLVSQSGQAVMVGPHAICPLALILHELATNSVKYGALGSGRGGKLDVSWKVEGAQLLLQWVEISSHRPSSPSQSSGFGSVLIKACGRQLGSTIEQQFTPDGAIITLSMPNEVYAS